jgi:hypothetical protein
MVIVLFWHQITLVVSYLVKHLGVSVVIPKLLLFQQKREVFPGDAMVFDESLLGPTPQFLFGVNGMMW